MYEHVKESVSFFGTHEMEFYGNIKSYSDIHINPIFNLDSVIEYIKYLKSVELLDMDDICNLMLCYPTKTFLNVFGITKFISNTEQTGCMLYRKRWKIVNPQNVMDKQWGFLIDSELGFQQVRFCGNSNCCLTEKRNVIVWDNRTLKDDSYRRIQKQLDNGIVQ
eukprot:UN29277